MGHIHQLPIRAGLFELDENNDFMPTGGCATQFERDANADIIPEIYIEVECDDFEFEEDENHDIMPKI